MNGNNKLGPMALPPVTGTCPSHPIILRNGKPVVFKEPPKICATLATIEDRVAILRNEIASGAKEVTPDLEQLVNNLDKMIMLMLFGNDYEGKEIWRA